MNASPFTPAPRPRRGLAVASLVLGVLSLLTLGGLGILAVLGLALGGVALVNARRHPERHGGKGLAIAGMAASALALVLLVVFVPSLLRSRVQSGESPVLGDTRTVISAQAAYASVNGGYYEGKLDCLATPGKCLPGYSGPFFLDEHLASLQTKSGYRRTFHPGLPPVSPAPTGSSVSPTSVTGYAYVAVPESPDAGSRAFCGDASGIVCSTTSGRAPAVKDGACDLATCTPLN